MISLTIQNLILIEKAEIHFGPGLNILTGETGSGKSAILSALRLLAGGRADSQTIRNGADLAVVEAIVGSKQIRREIHRSGKNRCFLNDELVSLATLREEVDIEMVDQSSSHTLSSPDSQRDSLDAFAQLSHEVAAFTASLAQEKEWERFLSESKQGHVESIEKELTFFEEVNVLPGEEVKLAQEHHILTHAQELAEKIGSIGTALSEGNEPLLFALKKIVGTLENCLRFDPKLTSLSQTMRSAVLEIEEVSRSVGNYLDQLQVDPQQLLAIEKRIATIEGLKRRFGPDLELEKNKLRDQLDHLHRLETETEATRQQLIAIKEKNRAWAHEITHKRKLHAAQLSASVLKELQSLNIPHAQFEVSVGEEFNQVTFLFSANPGIAPIPLEQCASGGELSRLLLAIKTILSTGCSTLVFDEIDSNVGGQTASILGEKLKQLAQKKQVICVTHFVQVAKFATDHFLVTKTEDQGLAYTKIVKLDAKNKEKEYSRMLGSHD